MAFHEISVVLGSKSFDFNLRSTKVSFMLPNYLALLHI